MANPRNTHTTDSAELVTPTLKADIYTTGRGGSGNMVPNEDPEIARVRQDVGVPVPVGNSEETFLTGRGKLIPTQATCIIQIHIHIQMELAYWWESWIGGAANAYRVTSREEAGPEADDNRELNRNTTTTGGEKGKDQFKKQ